MARSEKVFEHVNSRSLLLRYHCVSQLNEWASSTNFYAFDFVHAHTLTPPCIENRLLVARSQRNQQFIGAVTKLCCVLPTGEDNAGK